MIVTQTPLRIPLGGGGTDLPSYYQKHGGFLISAAINKHVYVVINQCFENRIRLGYSTYEDIENLEDIHHPIIRESLRLVGIRAGIEIISLADIPSNTGLGSSSSFTVGLLNAMHAYKRESVPSKQVAEEAFHIEAEILKQPVGKQDQYIAAFGGIQHLEISKDGQVENSPLELNDSELRNIESNLLLFYTGIQRNSSEILVFQSGAVAQGDDNATSALHTIKENGYQVKEALEAGDMNRLGNILHFHWQAKKRLSPLISSTQIDEWYNAALEHGAIGGKVMGAGGGGFFVLCCAEENQTRLRHALAVRGLKEMRYSFQSEGSRILIDTEQLEAINERE